MVTESSDQVRVFVGSYFDFDFDMLLGSLRAGDDGIAVYVDDAALHRIASAVVGLRGSVRGSAPLADEQRSYRDGNG